MNVCVEAGKNYLINISASSLPEKTMQMATVAKLFSGSMNTFNGVVSVAARRRYNRGNQDGR